MTNIFPIISYRGRLTSAAIFILLALVLAGCSLNPDSDPSSSETSADEMGNLSDDPKSSDNNETGEKSAGICANPYYPIHTAVSKEFKVTGSAPASYVLSHIERDNDSFTEKREFGSGLEVVSNWSCSEEGIRNADYSNTISNSQLKMKMETIESSGITLPKVWNKGEKWTTEYKVRVNAASQTANGTVTVTNEIVSMDDNVQVQAGDFVTARVDSVLTMNISMGKTKIPSPEFKMTNWYAPKVGLVKQETKGGFGTTKVEYVGEQ